MTIDLQRIETFLCAAETLSFSETAKQLHLSQPTVSHQIKTLEQELGAVLFERSGAGLRLTEAGQVLLPWAQRLMHDSSDLQAMMSSLQEIVGELRIACSTTAGKYVLPQLAARFRQKYPGIQIRIPACAPEQVALNLLEGDAHVGVLSREIQDPSLEVQEFFHDRITLIIPAQHHWANRPSIEPSELLKEPMILREPTSGTRSVVLEELAKHDISLEDLNIFLEVGNAEAIVRTIASGYGIGFVSELAADYALERGSVVSMKVEGLNLHRTIYMARKRLSDAYRPRDAFWSFVHAEENADLLRLPERGS
ncbi:MAG TPA: selenium metabolism-associated LysR family transcriptional regulator [Anaerolineales bacterium]|nr:selenium metabolism-associated LysR family transcriptional regulator [Anaerolineales bacterium]